MRGSSPRMTTEWINSSNLRAPARLQPARCRLRRVRLLLHAPALCAARAASVGRSPIENVYRTQCQSALELGAFPAHHWTSCSGFGEPLKMILPWEAHEHEKRTEKAISTAGLSTRGRSVVETGPSKRIPGDSGWRISRFAVAWR